MEDCHVERETTATTREFLFLNLRQPPDFETLDESAIDGRQICNVGFLREQIERPQSLLVSGARRFGQLTERNTFLHFGTKRRLEVLPTRDGHCWPFGIQ